MTLPILFESLDRIAGKERRSKLLKNDSELYHYLHKIKAKIKAHYPIGSDRMDLHIEITKDPDDGLLRQKTEQLHNQAVDLSKADTWGYLSRAFVVWTPEVAAYGVTHITVAYFAEHPMPTIDEIRALVLREG